MSAMSREVNRKGFKRWTLPLCAGFDVLPHVEQKIDGFVGKDDPLPENNELISRHVGVATRLLFAGGRKVMENGSCGMTEIFRQDRKIRR